MRLSHTCVEANYTVLLHPAPSIHSYVPFCTQARDLGVNVVIMGPSLDGTSQDLMAAADLWMEWPTFVKYHGNLRRSTAYALPEKVRTASTKSASNHGIGYASFRKNYNHAKYNT